MEQLSNPWQGCLHSLQSESDDSRYELIVLCRVKQAAIESDASCPARMLNTSRKSCAQKPETRPVQEVGRHAEARNAPTVHGVLKRPLVFQASPLICRCQSMISCNAIHSIVASAGAIQGSGSLLLFGRQSEFQHVPPSVALSNHFLLTPLSLSRLCFIPSLHVSSVLSAGLSFIPPDILLSGSHIPPTGSCWRPPPAIATRQAPDPGPVSTLHLPPALRCTTSARFVRLCHSTLDTMRFV